ncbi:MAG: hypothetical protein LBU26_02695 [Synergistaceae bacterium]|nr:hypothetical protein [Synergistaceae bacterium]
MNRLTLALILIAAAIFAPALCAASDEPATDEYRIRPLRHSLVTILMDTAGIKWGDAPERLGEDRVLVEKSGDARETYTGRSYPFNMPFRILGRETSGITHINEIRYHFKSGKLAAIDFICAEADGYKILEECFDSLNPPQSSGSKKGVFFNIFERFDDDTEIYVVNPVEGLPFIRAVGLRTAGADFSFSFDKEPIPNKPEGFGNLKWGDAPDALGANRTEAGGDANRRISVYSVRDSDVTFLGLPVKEARYSFARSKFFMAEVIFDEEHAARLLNNNTARKTFGEASMVRRAKEKVVAGFDVFGKEEYTWDDGDFIISLENSYPDSGRPWPTGAKMLFGPNAMIADALRSPRGGNWIDYAAGGFGGGSGTEGDPFIIAAPEQLAWLAVMVNGGNDMSGINFKMTSDIDLWESEWTPIGTSIIEGKNFNGTFDGGGHTITAMRITGKTTASGLFGVMGNGGTVRNITIRDGTALRAGVNTFAGGIACANYGYIDNCSADVTFTGVGVSGGIAAWNSGLISKCAAYGELSAGIGNRDITFSGGIVGYNYDGGSIKNCGANNVSLGSVSGGIAGINSYWGTVEGCSFDKTPYHGKDIGEVGRQEQFFDSAARRLRKDEKFREEAALYATLAAMLAAAVFFAFAASKVIGGNKKYLPLFYILLFILLAYSACLIWIQTR